MGSTFLARKRSMRSAALLLNGALAVVLKVAEWNIALQDEVKDYTFFSVMSGLRQTR